MGKIINANAKRVLLLIQGRFGSKLIEKHYDLTTEPFLLDHARRMDVERIINDIEQLREMFEAPDIRPLSPSDISAANRRHDEMLAHSPWFRLWQHFGVCCRPEALEPRLGEAER
jgi:hypothetical protein